MLSKMEAMRKFILFFCILKKLILLISFFFFFSNLKSWWFGVSVRNIKIQITALEVSLGTSGNWVALSRTSYNYWICSSCLGTGFI